MNKGLSAVLLAAGVVLLVLGLDAYHSTNSVISRFFTGASTDKAVWLLVGAAAAGALGFSGLMRK